MTKATHYHYYYYCCCCYYYYYYYYWKSPPPPPPPPLVFSTAHSFSPSSSSSQGATLSDSHLAEPASNASEYVDAPPLSLAYTNTSDPDPYNDTTTVVLPLYLTTTREKKVMEVRVPTQASPSKWILAGAAFFLACDDH